MNYKIDQTNIQQDLTNYRTNIRYKIVLIEDGLTLATVLKLQLEQSFRVKHFIKGEEALDYIFSNRGNIDAIFLDYMLPDMNGHDVLASIKMDTHLKHIPVILQTGLPIESLTNTIPLADLYIQKPYTDKDISAALTKVLNDRYKSE